MPNQEVEEMQTPLGHLSDDTVATGQRVSLPDMIPFSDPTTIFPPNLLPSSAIVSIGTTRPPWTRRATPR